MMMNSEASRNLENRNNVPFYRVVLTGGPCGGKTTALARVSSYLRERGFEVIMAPEVFTILASNGMSFNFFDTLGMDVVIQSTVLSVQLSLENGLENVLRARGKPAVLLCDRGAMDGAAYMDAASFTHILKKQDLDYSSAREGRYDAVFHMVTAADGANRYYTLENNDARSETPEEARILDQKTQAAWVGHPRLYIFDNSTDFEGKMQRLVETVAKLVGLPRNLSRSTAKFLLKGPPDFDKFTVDYHIFEVEKVYLTPRVQQQQQQKHHDTADASFYTDEYLFIRKRTHMQKDGTKSAADGSVHGMTVFQNTGDGNVVEKKRIISSKEYTASLMQRDPSRHEIRQKRISFLYKHQSFIIHIYEEPIKNLCILHAQVPVIENNTNEGELLQVDLPQFLNVERRLQNTKDDLKYGAFAVSLIDKKS